MRGGEKVLEVFCELFPRADLYTLVYDSHAVSPTIRAMNVRSSWIGRLPGARNYFRYLLPLFPKTIERFELDGYDLILSSSHCVAKGIFPQRAMHVAYVHAPMRYIWDMGEAYFAGGASLAMRAGLTLCRRYLQRWDVRSSGRVDFFIANSNNVAAKLRNLYKVEATVIYPPVEYDRFFVVAQPQVYYLIVSALVGYKRLDIAINAFNDSRLPLKIVGDGPLRKMLEKRARPNIEFLGWVNDEQLARLYASSQALIFPGEDDFGIVPLEAQASGRPVIAYAKGGVLETVVPLNSGDLSPSGEPTGVFFHESSPAHLIEAVHYFRENTQRFEPAAIRHHASRFSRERFKAQMKEYLDSRMKSRFPIETS
jgi:glycosyltransferase involved in cell wall biosynthesis